MRDALIAAAVAQERERLRVLVEAVRDANCEAEDGDTFRLLKPGQERAWIALLAGFNGPDVRVDASPVDRHLRRLIAELRNMQRPGSESELTVMCADAADALTELLEWRKLRDPVTLRDDRDALGLKRLELYAHPDDWPAIKALAEKLQRKRAKLAAPRAG